MKALFLASSCTDEATMRYRGVSQASSNWLTGLMSGIVSAGGTAVAFAHVHDALWPKGFLFPGRKEDLESSIDQVLIRYGNIPGLRSRWLTRALVASVSKHIKTYGSPDVILTYNLYPYYVDAAKILAAKFNILWVPIILDLDDPELNNWVEFNAVAGTADACVFLSWWAYLNAPCTRKLHLDAGGQSVSRSTPTEKNRKIKTVVYAGKIADYGGMTLLAAAIRGVKDQDVKFVICGKGKSETLEELAHSDNRVTVAGFVSDQELNEICQDADLFINPRPTDFQENKMIFPSKIMFYLGFGAPVVSTWTPGLSPDFKDYLIVPQEEDAQSLADSISAVLSWPENKLADYRAQVADFLNRRSWPAQGKRLTDFVETVAKTRKS